MDSDGDLDVVTYKGYLYQNNGSGTFTAIEDRLFYSHYDTYSIFSADLNQDGKVDFITSFAWYENTGDLTFIEHDVQNEHHRTPSFQRALDMDGDGDLDLLTNTEWYENIGDNCPNVSNADQADTDEDGIGDACE